ncbi:MAG: DUF4342 domain-containing protein [Symbiobacteriaceae bacterium]|nr:DUF4342 domain-containing protein [Symbiobacteriaceae bacterium]
MDEMLLEKIDLIRERMKVSYLEARQALEQTDGNVVEALVLLEKGSTESKAAKQAEQDQKFDEFVVKGNDLVAKVNELFRQGNITRIKILHEDNVLFEVPLTAGAAAVLLLPQLALLTGIAVLFARVTVQIEKPVPAGADCECDCGCSEEKPADCSECDAPCEETPEPIIDEENPHI